MKCLVIYASEFGNTEKIARKIGETLATGMDVSILPAKEARLDMFSGLNCVVVGSATQKFGMLPPVKLFLKGIPDKSLQGVKAAAFDTRFNAKEMKSAIGRFFVGTFGYAAKPILEGLKKKGGVPLLPPEGFFVTDTEGPIKDGELERSAAWAQKLLDACR